MEDLPVPRIDLVEESRTNLLAVAFARTNSPVYALAVNAAKRATRYECVAVGKSVAHLAVFDKTRASAIRALELLRYVAGWKAVQVCAGGTILRSDFLAGIVLSCYVQSLDCDDWRAHCFCVIDDPSALAPYEDRLYLAADVSIERSPKKDWLLPCKLLYGHVRFQRLHPATFRDQLQAAAAEYGCAWCPNFNIEFLGEVPPPI